MIKVGSISALLIALLAFGIGCHKTNSNNIIYGIQGKRIWHVTDTSSYYDSTMHLKYDTFAFNDTFGFKVINNTSILDTINQLTLTLVTKSDTSKVLEFQGGFNISGHDTYNGVLIYNSLNNSLTYYYTKNYLIGSYYRSTYVTP